MARESCSSEAVKGARSDVTSSGGVAKEKRKRRERASRQAGRQARGRGASRQDESRRCAAGGVPQVLGAGLPQGPRRRLHRRLPEGAAVAPPARRSGAALCPARGGPFCHALRGLAGSAGPGGGAPESRQGLRSAGAGGHQPLLLPLAQGIWHHQNLLRRLRARAAGRPAGGRPRQELPPPGLRAERQPPPGDVSAAPWAQPALRRLWLLCRQGGVRDPGEAGGGAGAVPGGRRRPAAGPEGSQGQPGGLRGQTAEPGLAAEGPRDPPGAGRRRRSVQGELRGAEPVSRTLGRQAATASAAPPRAHQPQVAEQRDSPAEPARPGREQEQGVAAGPGAALRQRGPGLRGARSGDLLLVHLPEAGAQPDERRGLLHAAGRPVLVSRPSLRQPRSPATRSQRSGLPLGEAAEEPPAQPRGRAPGSGAVCRDGGRARATPLPPALVHAPGHPALVLLQHLPLAARRRLRRGPAVPEQPPHGRAADGEAAAPLAAADRGGQVAAGGPRGLAVRPQSPVGLGWTTEGPSPCPSGAGSSTEPAFHTPLSHAPPQPSGSTFPHSHLDNGWKRGRKTAATQPQTCTVLGGAFPPSSDRLADPPPGFPHQESSRCVGLQVAQHMWRAPAWGRLS